MGGHEPEPTLSGPSAQGGRDELRQLLERLRPRMRALFARFHVPAQETEDLLQQALLALVVKWESIECREAWLLGALRKHCLLYWRRRRRALYQAVEVGVLERLSSPVVPEQERREMAHDVGRMLDDLPQRCRRVLRLRYLDGLTPPEVADRLGYRRSSIGKVTARCMAHLAERAVRRSYLSPQVRTPRKR
jgi:RNA polymerase sigma-70 factor (ECF subfamily)